MWKSGDVAIIAPHDGAIPAGEEVLLTKFLGDQRLGDRVINQVWVVCYGGELGWWASEGLLRPLPPPNEVTSWEDCIFKPKEVVGTT